MKINCPKCGEETEFFLNNAIDELGEVYRCKKCGWPFRYVKEPRYPYKENEVR